MEFRILGPLEVVANGQQLAPLRAKQRALLATLLLRANEAVPTDELIDAVWGERPPQTAQTALHGHISALRKLLGTKRIETKPPGYLLRAEPDELDVARFESLLAEADRAEDAALTSTLLGEALDLWRGDPLGEFRYDAFAQAAIARLEDLRLVALERRIAADLDLGRHREVATELEQLVRAYPLRESIREQLMLALYRAGRQADALHAYQEGRRVLSEELGLDPGASLQALERRILNEDPSLELPAEEAPLTQQVRKVVTVVVLEIVSTGIDPEDFDEFVQPALARARATFEEFGATVEPLFANARVAIFGAPRAHEDDAERAVRAASKVVEAFAAEENLTVRVGIHCGEALVTTTGDHVDITGDVLIEASRLQATAAANDVVVSDAVKRALEHVRSEHEVAFVGREHELRLLEQTYERVVRENAVQLVTIAGEPGSGKTRLAKEFRAALAPQGQHTWLEGRCLPYGEGVTFWALGEIVKGWAGILESDDSETSAQKLSASLADVLPESDDRKWVEANVSPLVGVAGSAGFSREQSFAAWRRFLESVAWRGPLVLLIEDVHWGDPALFEFVDDLLDRAGAVPLLVVCTARIELLDARPQWGGGKRNATTVTLPPLTPDETRELARSVVGAGEPSEALVARAGGNPLFAQELARIDGTEADSLPESLQVVIAARLDTLAPQVKEAAMDAAVVGEVFWSGTLGAIAAIDEAEVGERLRRLVAGDVVRPARTSSVKGQREYAFLHVLVRDVAYEQIPRAKRARKHQAVAVWIEQLAGARVIDHAELIAHHYSAALDLARDDELTATTRHFLLLAGDRAMQLDVAAADRFYERALALVADDVPERAHVLTRIARGRTGSGTAGRCRTSLRGGGRVTPCTERRARPRGRAGRLLHGGLPTGKERRGRNAARRGGRDPRTRAAGP